MAKFNAATARLERRYPSRAPYLVAAAHDVHILTAIATAIATTAADSPRISSLRCFIDGTSARAVRSKQRLWCAGRCSSSFTCGGPVSRCASPAGLQHAVASCGGLGRGERRLQWAMVRQAASAPGQRAQ